MERLTVSTNIFKKLADKFKENNVYYFYVGKNGYASLMKISDNACIVASSKLESDDYLYYDKMFNDIKNKKIPVDVVDDAIALCITN